MKYVFPIGSYAKIYEWVRRIPEGKVATYGQIAGLVGNCSARQVGYALASLAEDSGVSWHRVINSQGRISRRSGAEGHHLQRLLLEAEGIVFSADDSIDLNEYRWATAVSDADFLSSQEVS